jgi:hypothetical protein
MLGRLNYLKLMGMWTLAGVRLEAAGLPYLGQAGLLSDVALWTFEMTNSAKRERVKQGRSPYGMVPCHLSKPHAQADTEIKMAIEEAAPMGGSYSPTDQP